MSSERIFASWIAFRPASMPMSRKERSHNSPNSVSPIPITATSRTRSSLPHQDLAAVLRVRRIVEELLVRNQFLDRRGGIAPELRDLVRDGQIEPVGARAATVPDGEDAVSGLGFVEDRAEAHHDRPAVRVPDLPDAQARVDLGFFEPKLLRGPHRKFPVRLMEDGVVVVLRRRSRALEEQLRARADVLEIRRFTGESTAVTRVSLSLATPEVRRVRRIRNGVGDLGRDAVDPDQQGCPTRGGAVLEGVPGSPLARVRTDRETVLHHLGQGQAHRRLDCGGAGLAGELEVRRGQDRSRADRLRDDGRGRFDGIRMGLGTDVDRADLGRIDVDLGHARPGRFHGDRDHILVGPGDALRPDVQSSTHRLAVGAPDRAYVLRSDAIAGNVSAVADDPRLHEIRSSSASFIASSSMFSGCTYTTIAGFSGCALIAIIGERPYLTPVKQRARSLVDPYMRR